LVNRLLLRLRNLFWWYIEISAPLLFGSRSRRRRGILAIRRNVFIHTASVIPDCLFKCGIDQLFD
jgi:hypothetical protein